MTLSVLGACSVQPTPYQPKDGAGGYAEQRLDARTWRVQFQGNYATGRETVENYLLLRSAEIVLAAGFERFAVAEKDVEQITDYHTYSAQPFCEPYWYGRPSHYRYGYPYCYGPQYYPDGPYAAYTRYTGYAVVRALVPGEPSPDLQTYDARDVAQQLRGTVRLPLPSGSY